MGLGAKVKVVEAAGRRVVGWQPLLALGVLAVLALVPLVLTDSYFLAILIRILFYAGLATSWNLLGGYGGQISLGHAAFLGVGAYTLSILFAQWSIPVWLGFAASGVLGTFLSFGIGFLCFRLRGPYFMLATLALAEVLKEIVMNWTPVTGGNRGLAAPPLPFEGGKVPYYWAALLIAVACTAAVYLITRSKLGYSLRAIREDEDAAEAVGVDTARAKATALAISAFFTGVAGAFYASYIGFIYPQSVLGIGLSIEMIVTTIVGGAGTLAGPLVGAAVLGATYEYFRVTFKEAYLLVYGAGLAAVVFFIPGGVVGEMKRLWRFLSESLGGKARDATS